MSYFRADGEEIESLPNPTDDLTYGEPPTIEDAVLSPDGTALAYMEGPDASGSKHPEEILGNWTLVVQDQRTGDERLRIYVADEDRAVTRLDFDGRWIVLSMRKQTDSRGNFAIDPLPAIVVDTNAEEPMLRQLPDVVGVVSIADRVPT